MGEELCICLYGSFESVRQLLLVTEWLLFTGNVPRGVFCEQSSQKTRELRREIMQSMIFVHCEACYCEGCER